MPSKLANIPKNRYVKTPYRGKIIIIGVTGGIAMGKTLIAKLLGRNFNIPIYDADKEVHRIYQTSDMLQTYIKQKFPDAYYFNNSCDGRIIKGINRKILADYLFADKQALRQVEAIIYPLIRKRMHKLIQNSVKYGYNACVLDIPLLFEKGIHNICDVTINVFASDISQKHRALKRGLSEEKLDLIRGNQMPTYLKNRLADYNIKTGCGKSNILRHIMQNLQYLA